MNDVDADLGLVHLIEGVLKRFDGALNIRFHDEVEVGLLAFLDPAEEIIEAHMRLMLLLSQALSERTFLGELTGIAFVLEDAELITGHRYGIETQDLHRVSRIGGIHMLTMRIDQSANMAVGGAGNNGIARMKRTALDQHRRNRPSTLVEVRLDDEA